MYFHGLLIYLFLHCRSAFTQELNDVTTVYSIGQNIKDDFAYVHLANKNATSKFMSLMIGDRIVDSVIPNNIADLTREQENLRHWEDQKANYYGTGACIECSYTQDFSTDSLALSKYVTFNKYTCFEFKLDEVDVCKLDLKLILTGTDKPISDQKQFYLITSDGCRTFIFYKCNGTIGSDHVYINDIKFTCWNVQRSTVGNQNSISKLELYINQLEEEINIISIAYDRYDKYAFDKVLEWEDDSPINIHFYAIHASNSETKTNILNKVYPIGQYIEPKKNYPYRSKWFIPPQKKQCMTLVFYTKESFNNPLQIYLEKEDSSDKTYLGVVGKYSKVGWQIGSVILTWPEGNSRVRFALETAYEGVFIERIYTLEMDDTIGCSSEDKGITALLRTDYKNAISDNVIILARTNYTGEISAMAVLRDTDLTKRKPVSFLPNKISNSGSTECEFYKNPCPPGFTGTYCDQGCGRNHFGADCNSVCSTRQTECKGLLLCTPSVGCVCPPGYRGETCEEECDNGFYGNNCSLTCGHCKEGTCDIYTGKCSLCQPGYHLPMCKRKHIVTSSAPHVNVTAFGEVTVTPDFSNVTDKSRLKFYSVEYRKLLSSNPWIKYVTLLFPKNDDPQKSIIIKGLEHGVAYEIRIVLMDKDLNSYELIPTASFVSQCTIPDTDLILEAHSNKSSVTVSWQFKNDETKQSNYWCPVQHFEVYWKEGWKWFSVNTTENTISLLNQLPAMSFDFKIRALTRNGYTSYSSTAHVSTPSPTINTDPVKNLTVSEVDSTSAVLHWQPLLMDSEITYIIEYKCIFHPACQKDCSGSTGEVSTTRTHFKLVDLLPFSQYFVTVYPILGPKNSSPNVIFGTTMGDQMETPEQHTEMSTSTNTSVTVYWKEPEVCSGFFSNYYYKLFKEDDFLRDGVTLDTKVTLGNLIPSTDYKVRVYVQLLNSSINMEKYLEINVTTSASVSDKVRNLTVYKQGRSLLGIRWAPPERVYGTLKSFTVTTELNGAAVKSSVLEPTPCIIWPHLFCYSITSLNANKIYTVSVSARNVESNADGANATVTGLTREKLPLAPENIEILGVTSNTVDVQWDYPFLVNGILRSFVLNLEETDRFESDKCCEIYPLIEIPVKEELEHYLTKVTGVKPASTYELSISAKTVGLGPQQKLTVQTRPPQIPATHPNITNINTNLLHNGWHWINNSDSSEPYSYEIYSPLIREPMLLLVVTNDTAVNETGITDVALNKELKSIVLGNFYLAREYTDESSDITIGDGTVIDGAWGKIRNIPLKMKTDYQLAAVRITYYKGIYNLAVTLTTVFAAA